MIDRRIASVAMTALVLLFTGTPFAQVGGPGFAGVAPAPFFACKGASVGLWVQTNRPCCRWLRPVGQRVERSGSSGPTQHFH
jgi:hypothetical protein